jgi:hypothetical protein
MLDVCLHNQPGPARRYLPRPNRITQTQRPPYKILTNAIGQQNTLAFEYQNMVRSTYAPVPRPPQTRAAHFKRPYQN